jgi:hypothetical protein
MLSWKPLDNSKRRLPTPSIPPRVPRYPTFSARPVTSPSADPSVLVLWLDQVTRRFCGEPPQNPRVDSYREPLPCAGSSRDFVLLFLPPCDPHLIPFCHRVHHAEPTCISTPRRPRKAKTFRARSSPVPSQIKQQPEPAILDQESVHTTLSITHHSKERPSTGPRMFWSSGRRWHQSIIECTVLASDKI